MITVPDVAAMTAFGARLGAALRAGDAVCLEGPLGAGKTTLTRGIAAGLGINAGVSSPTFVISRRYPGPTVDLVHCDAYRLAADDDFADIVPDPDRVVTVIEWGTPVMSAVADSWLVVTVDRTVGLGDDVRQISLSGVGAEWDDARVNRIAEGAS